MCYDTQFENEVDACNDSDISGAIANDNKNIVDENRHNFHNSPLKISHLLNLRPKLALFLSPPIHLQ